MKKWLNKKKFAYKLYIDEQKALIYKAEVKYRNKNEETIENKH